MQLAFTTIRSARLLASHAQPTAILPAQEASTVKVLATASEHIGLTSPQCVMLAMAAINCNKGDLSALVVAQVG